LTCLVRAKEVKAEIAWRPTEIEAGVAEVGMSMRDGVVFAIVESAYWMMASPST
jgi:hypothetical protein